MPPCRRRSGSRRRSTRKKEEELTAEEKNQREELSKKVVTLRDERNERLRQIGEKDSLVRQIIDLALLTNGMLKGKNFDGVHPAIDLADREISGHGTRSIKRGYVLSGHIPFCVSTIGKSTASLSDAGSSPPPHAADCTAEARAVPAAGVEPHGNQT